jgi:hypothetical protein
MLHDGRSAGTRALKIPNRLPATHGKNQPMNDGEIPGARWSHEPALTRQRNDCERLAPQGD